MHNRLDDITRRQFIGGTLLAGSGLLLGVEIGAREQAIHEYEMRRPAALRPGCLKADPRSHASLSDRSMPAPIPRLNRAM